jgi:hypothetical protein
MKKLFFCVALFFAVSLVNAQSLKSLDKFKASFEMDSAESLGGGEYKLTASGEAGPYGRVFCNFHFTNKLNNQNGLGEFTGMAWSQVGDVISEATLQGASKFNGKTFTVYSFDSLTDGKIMMWKGEFDFVNKTVELEVQQIE